MPQESRAFSIRTATHRYVNWPTCRSMLRPARSTEMQDLGRDAARAAMRDRLLHAARRKHRTSVSDEFVASRTDTHKKAGVF